jgi:hypothetical protein
MITSAPRSTIGLGVAGVLLVMAVSGWALLRQPGVSPSRVTALAMLNDNGYPSETGQAKLIVDEDGGELVIIHGPVDLPGTGVDETGHYAHQYGGVFPEVSTVEVPEDFAIFGFYADLIDGQGNEVPTSMLHHVNVVDPDRRELFAPISMRVAAAGTETGYRTIPPALLGSPLYQGQQLIIHTMLHNGTPANYSDVYLRFHFRVKPAAALGPLLSVFPFWVDVKLPAGDKTFDLPPGISSQSYEASPAVEARILALSGHVHDLATSLRFEDVTNGDVIWEAESVTDETGAVASLPTGLLLLKGGYKIVPEHSYRLTVEYENLTGETIVDGGMGSIGGVVLPVDMDAWPSVDKDLQIYQLDLDHYFRRRLGKLKDLSRVPEPVHEHMVGESSE